MVWNKRGENQWFRIDLLCGGAREIRRGGGGNSQRTKIDSFGTKPVKSTTDKESDL